MKLKKTLAAIAASALTASVITVPAFTESTSLLSTSNITASASYVDEVVIDNVVYHLFDGYSFKKYTASVWDCNANSGTVTIQDSISYNGQTYDVTTIGNISDCNITKIDAHNAVHLTEICTIENCPSLEEIIIPPNVENSSFIHSFDNCPKLSKFTINGTSSNYEVIDGVIYNKDKTKLIRYPGAKSDISFTIPSTVETIGFNAFIDGSHISNLNVNEAATSENASTIIEKYNAAIDAMEGDNLKINNEDFCTFSSDNKSEPVLGSAFKNAIYEEFLELPEFSERYAERYAEYVANTYVNPGDGDIQKAIKLHDWLCNQVRYNPLTSKFDGFDRRDHVDASAFLHFEFKSDVFPADDFYTVCDGYARAYKLLMNKAGVVCEIVEGFPKEDDGHVWNLAKINGRYYYIDTTWDDRDEGFDYEYFMCSKEEFDKSHNRFSYVLRLATKDEINSLDVQTYSIHDLGDVNFDNRTNIADLNILKQTDINELSEVQKVNADVNFDGIFDKKDIDILERYLNSIAGDVNRNGIIDAEDANLVQGYLDGKFGCLEFGSNEELRADADQDGDIDSDDISAINDRIGAKANKRSFLENIRMMLLK
ncbi:MAG: hypothetical protein K5979_00355 [Ruminococcus sp.]|nr:hypothetical protein [Ruminococcus sp.]